MRTCIFLMKGAGGRRDPESERERSIPLPAGAKMMSALFEAPQIEWREFKLPKNLSKMFKKLRKEKVMKSFALADMLISTSLMAWDSISFLAEPSKFRAKCITVI